MERAKGEASGDYNDSSYQSLAELAIKNINEAKLYDRTYVESQTDALRK